MSESVPEVAARQKYACPSCGAEAQWNAAKHALVCPFCGTESPAKLSEAGALEIHENDLLAALQNLGGEKRGLQTEKKAVKCQSCQAITLFDPKVVAQRCDFCGSSALIPVEQQSAAIRPESLLEFKLSEDKIRDLVHQWYRSRWFAPSAFKVRALTDTIRGIYLPYWTFDAQVHATWTAESGYYYYVDEEYTDSNGERKTRSVQHTRWEYSSGALDHFYDDDLVPASRGVPTALLKKIEPFPTTTDLKPYDPGYLAGWTVEQYQIDLVAAAKEARDDMDAQTRNLCARNVPGDTHRNLMVQSDYSGQTFKHILVPVWVLAYTYGAKSFQLVANGYTGALAGKHPLSWVKITFAILAVLLIIIILASLSQSHGH